jgi:hypothetical protein
MVEAVRIRDRHSTITYTKESKLGVCVDDNVEPLTNTTQREWVECTALGARGLGESHYCGGGMSSTFEHAARDHRTRVSPF